MMYCRTALLLLSFILLSACNHTASEPTAVPIETPQIATHSGIFVAKSSSANPSPAGQSALRSRTVTIDTQKLFKQATTQPLTALTLNFFDDAVFSVTKQKQILNQSGSVTWLGTLPAATGSMAMLNISQDRIDGSLDIPNQGLFSVRYLSDGSHLVEEINRSAIR
ncbi:MAG: hypothetical protein ACPG47_08280 [Leucothrix sp.]